MGAGLVLLKDIDQYYWLTPHLCENNVNNKKACTLKMCKKEQYYFDCIQHKVCDPWNMMLIMIVTTYPQ